jgi:UDP-N-acetylmuramoyl-tripeptide--D-alanyl-D-alanine ligase
MTASPLWTVEAMARAMNAARAGALPASVNGISIDSRGIGAGDAFFAIKGDNRDGHEFVGAALKAGAGLAVVAADWRGNDIDNAPLLRVPDVLEGLRALARAARARLDGKVVGITGSVGKTGTKEALRLALGASGATHASVASYNNHWGVPLSLARCPADVRYAVFEMGMNHAGEIEPLSKLARPHVAIITTVEPVHLEFFGSVEAIADAKAEIFRGLERGGAAVINRDNPHFERLAAAARSAGARIVSFGEHAKADARLVKLALQPDGSTVEARILGADVAYKLGAPGKHQVLNSLAVLAAASLVGADLALAALALASVQPATGRGARSMLALGVSGDALLIDESYNANPASMRAAIALLGQAEIGPQGRRIAVLGDMLELGASGADLHRGLVDPIRAHGIDLVYCCGPLMHALWEGLPSERRGGYAESAGALEADVIAAIRPGDAVMVKGSLGSRMGPIVKALERQYSRRDAPAAAARAQG